jgi:hypothetical protein
MPENNVERGAKVVRDLAVLIDNRSVAVLFLALLLGNVIQTTLLVRAAFSSRDRETELLKVVVEEVRRQAPGIVKEEVAPLKQQVSTTLTKTDSILLKADSIITR